MGAGATKKNLLFRLIGAAEGDPAPPFDTIRKWRPPGGGLAADIVVCVTIGEAVLALPNFTLSSLSGLSNKILFCDF